MGFLSKDDYQRRAENSDKRMLKNKENSSLSEEQHDALSNLCKVRHSIHSNMEKHICNGLGNSLIECNIELLNSGLERMSFVPIETSDYIDIDCFDVLYETENVPEDDKEKQDWYDDNYHRISGELEGLNTKIENYLKNIDNNFGTNYCPTGQQRIF